MGTGVRFMKIYEHWEAVPSRVYGLVDLLMSAGRSGMKESTVISLMQPRTLRSDDRESPIAPNTIDAAIEAGLVQCRPDPDGDGELLHITDMIYKLLHRQPLQEMLPVVVDQLLLQPEVGGKENRFATLCAWLLAQPTSWTSQGQGDLQNRLTEQGMDLTYYGVTNSSCLDNVLYWAKYLGLIWQAKDEGGKAIVPDPTTYLRRHIDIVLPQAEVVDAHEFRRRVGQLCPVLDSGVIRTQVLEKLQLRGAKPWPSDQLSDALSLAIRGLSEMKLLRYGYRNDARVFLTLSRGERIASLERT
jgi:hypothetical protein